VRLERPSREIAGTGASFDVDALRAKEFPWTQTGQTIFMNAASTGPLPRRTVETAEAWAALRAEPHRLTDAALFAALSRSRELIATLIGARASEIALAVNTSYGMNLAALALPLAPGDVIITPDLEFPANVYPWAAVASARGLEYRRIPLRNGVLDEDDLHRALEDRAVKCVSVSWVGFANGYRVDLARLGRACRRQGAYFVVDAIQGLGPCTIDVSTLEIDILACGAQKWLLSPWGAGFVYVRRELAQTLDPPMVSWMAARGTDDFGKLTEYDFDWRDDARRYEFVTLPFQDFAGMNSSLELFMELGPARIAEHITRLADDIVSWSRDTRTPLVTPADRSHRAGIVCVKPRDAASVSARLKAAGVVHSYREGGIRLSPHIYNTSDEMRRALELIAS
jgi:cysteine desulfurase / selenocysteine lyase